MVYVCPSLCKLSDESLCAEKFETDRGARHGVTADRKDRRVALDKRPALCLWNLR